MSGAAIITVLSGLVLLLAVLRAAPVRAADRRVPCMARPRGIDTR